MTTKPKVNRRIQALEQQVQECINKMDALLREASDAEHQIEQITAPSDEDEFHRRAGAIGHIVTLINDLCGPRLELVLELVFRIWDMDEHETEQIDEAKTVLH